jgi:hypothetical protein
MAGAYTHLMVVEAALGTGENYARLNPGHELAAAVKDNKSFVSLGAVSPDCPYLTPESIAYGIAGQKIHSWSDRMHYEKVKEFIRIGVEKLAVRSHDDDDDFYKRLAWFMGYVSHVVTDVTVHPVVNSIVGPYVFNSTEHLHCEMIQDAYIYKKVTTDELVRANYLDHIQQCSDANGKLAEPVAQLWKDILEDTFRQTSGKDHFDTIDPYNWYEKYVTMLRDANSPSPLCRYILDFFGKEYKETGKFDRDTEYKFIYDIKRPDIQATVDFDDIFKTAVSNVVNIWGKIITDIEAGDVLNCKTYINDWNLDLGVDLGRLDLWQ